MILWAIKYALKYKLKNPENFVVKWAGLVRFNRSKFMANNIMTVNYHQSNGWN